MYNFRGEVGLGLCISTNVRVREGGRVRAYARHRALPRSPKDVPTHELHLGPETCQISARLHIANIGAANLVKMGAANVFGAANYCMSCSQFIYNLFI